MTFDHPEYWVRWRFAEVFGEQFASRIVNRSPFVTDAELRQGFRSQMKVQAQEWGLPEIPDVSW